MSDRELDRYIAEKVMGCHVVRNEKECYDLVIPGGVNQIDYVEEVGAWKGVPKYSSSDSDACRVLDAMREGSPVLALVESGDWRCCITTGSDFTEEHVVPGSRLSMWHRPIVAAEHESRPMAICLAAKAWCESKAKA